MTAKRAGSNVSVMLLGGVVASLTMLSALACDERAADASEATSEAPVVHEAAPEATKAAAAKSSYSEQAFKLEFKGVDTAKVGAAQEYTIILTPGGGYKVNEEYPIKFKFAKSEGVTPAKEVVRKDDGTVAKTGATLPLSVTFSEAGVRQVTGKLSFSVCTEERCLIEKRELSLSVTAS